VFTFFFLISNGLRDVDAAWFNFWLKVYIN